MVKLILLILFTLIPAGASYALVRGDICVVSTVTPEVTECYYVFRSATGDGNHSLDSIDGNLIFATDMAVVIDRANGYLRVYSADLNCTDEGNTCAKAGSVTPLVNGGNIRWATVPNDSVKELINTFSELQAVVADATLLKGGTLTNTKFCTYDSVGGEIDCNSEGGVGDFSDGGESSGSNRTLGNIDAYSLGFKTMDTVRLHIANDGKIGIGTVSPTNLVHVEGDVRLNNLILGATTGTLATVVVENAGTDIDITANNSAGNQLYLDNGGNVGIGTTSPEYKFHVAGETKLVSTATGSQALRVLNTATSGNKYAVNGTVTGTGDTNVALYGYADEGTNNYGLYIDAGKAYFNDVAEFTTNVSYAGTLTSTSVDGTHYINISNGTVFSGTPVDGDEHYHTDLNERFIYDGSQYVNMVQRIYQSGAPSAGDCDTDTERGRPDVLDTAANVLYICNGATRGWDSISLTN